MSIRQPIYHSQQFKRRCVLFYLFPKLGNRGSGGLEYRRAYICVSMLVHVYILCRCESRCAQWCVRACVCKHTCRGACLCMCACWCVHMCMCKFACRCAYWCVCLCVCTGWCVNKYVKYAGMCGCVYVFRKKQGLNIKGLPLSFCSTYSYTQSGQWTNFWDQFSTSTMWVPEVNLRTLGSVAAALTS